MTRTALAVCLFVAGAAACAETPIRSAEFTCERNASIPATYVGQGADAVVVLVVDGRQVGLRVTRSGSGVRFADPDGGYVWHEKGPSAVLIWEEEGSTQTIFADCKSG